MEEIECPYCGFEVTEAIYKCECGKILICDENGSIKD